MLCDTYEADTATEAASTTTYRFPLASRNGISLQVRLPLVAPTMAHPHRTRILTTSLLAQKGLAMSLMDRGVLAEMGRPETARWAALQ